MAQSLGMSVTAEGVETVEQLKPSTFAGLRRGQGYYSPANGAAGRRAVPARASTNVWANAGATLIRNVPVGSGVRSSWEIEIVRRGGSRGGNDGSAFQDG